MIFRISQLFTKNTQWLEQQQSSILSAAAIITVANIISSLSGLLRERLLIDSYFATTTSQLAYEAYQVAFQIPDMLFQLIVLGAISAAFIPTFTQLRKKNEADAFAMAATVTNILTLVFIVAAVGAFIFAEPITAWRTGSGFSAEQINIAARLTRLMLFAQVFFALSNFLTGILQSYQRFILPAIAPVLYNVGIIAGTYAFADKLGIYAAGVGVIIGAFIHMAIQLPLAWKLGFRFRWQWNLNIPGVKQLFRMMPPRLLAIGVSEIQNLGLTFFATSIGNLSYVIVRLALRLMTLPIRVFGVPISQASLPFLSEESAETDRAKFRMLLLQSVHQITFLALPASVLLLILRIPIVRLVFGADDFPWRTTVLTGQVVAIIAISVSAQALVQLFVRAFYALKDTMTPLRITIITVMIYLVASAGFVFLTSYQLWGLAIATSLSAFVEAGIFLLLLHRRIGGLMGREFFVPQAKMLAASFLMAIFLYLPFRILDELIFDTTRTAELIALTLVTSTIGVVVYAYFAALFDVRELGYLVRLMSRFGMWRKPLEKTTEVLTESTVEQSEV